MSNTGYATPLRAALAYAGRGWPVFPCRPRGKTPATRHGCKDATTDAAAIAAWWGERPDNNVAIATGNGFIVLDADKKLGMDGDETLKALAKTLGPLPETLM